MKQYTYRRSDGAANTRMRVDEGSVMHYALAAAERAQEATKRLHDAHLRDVVRQSQLALIDRVEQLVQVVITERANADAHIEEAKSLRRQVDISTSRLVEYEALVSKLQRIASSALGSPDEAQLASVMLHEITSAAQQRAD